MKRKGRASGVAFGASALAGVATLGAAIAGCASQREADPPRAALAPQALAVFEPLPPFALGGDEGLEIRRWISATSAEALRASLGGVAEPAPLTDAMRERLARAGFALLRAPRESLLTVRAGVADVRRLERVWIGQSPAWRELIASDQRLATVRVGERMVDLRRDRPRLLIRAWQAPGSSGPEVRLDLAVADGAARRSPLMAALGEAPAPPPEVAPLAGAYVSLALDARWAYFLVIDDAPTMEALPSPAAQTQASDAKRAWAPAPLRFGALAPSAKAVGPPMPPTLTPAQALLTATAVDDEGAACMALVFLAHVDSRWRPLH